MNILNIFPRLLRRIFTELPLYFLKPQKPSEGIIISLTSYPARLSNLHFVIRSLLKQSLQAEKIILYLGTDTKDSDIPQRLKDLTKYNFEIRTGYEDIKPHKKYFFAMQEYPEHIIVTVDDDIMYHKDFLKDLYNSYKKYPDSVQARRVTKLTSENGNLNEYAKFEYKYKSLLTPSHSLLAIGCGGVLYPPEAFTKDDFNADLIKETCLNTDDIYLKYLEVKNDRKVVFVPSKYEKDLSVRNTQDSGLFHINYQEGNRNDLALQALEKATRINLADYLK
ncbi:hypothetical protein [Treponema sp. C6A8]|uniref:hypothetical protein n=1 Tax=Treponema sp. C6A8 TaxID=1410609 RepID=UPI0006864F90|nr:hypothetical protein [Treponema sp. C6A8]